MLLSISKSHLIEMCDAAARISPKRTTLPILENVLLETTGTGLRATATDLDRTVIKEAPAQVERSGAVVVPVRKLRTAVRSLPAASSVRLEASSCSLVVTARNSERTIEGCSVDDFPVVPEFEPSCAVRVRTRDLQRLISQTAFAVSTEENRPVLNGVLARFAVKELTFFATDGHRLARASALVSPVADRPLVGDVIVPPRTLHESVRLFEHEPEVQLGLPGPPASRPAIFLRLTAGANTLISRLIEGPYPDLEPVIPSTHRFRAEASVDELIAALKRIRRMKGSEEASAAQLRFTPGQLVMSGSGLDYRAGETVSVEYREEPSELRVNLGYLSEILEHMPSGPVLFRWTSSEKGIEILPPESDDKLLFLLMPLRRKAS